MLVDEIHKIQEDSIQKKRIEVETNYQNYKDIFIEYIKECVKNNPTKEYIEIHRDRICLDYEKYYSLFPKEKTCLRITSNDYNRLIRELQVEGVILEKIEVYELIITDKFLKTKPLEVKVDEYYKISWGK